MVADSVFTSSISNYIPLKDEEHSVQGKCPIGAHIQAWLTTEHLYLLKVNLKCLNVTASPTLLFLWEGTPGLGGVTGGAQIMVTFFFFWCKMTPSY